jgi:hypothetical protein
MALRRRGTLHLMKKNIPLIILTLILILLPSIPFAQVQTRLRVIRASNVGAGFDPVLTDVHSQLGSLFNFTSYRLLRDESLSLSLNQPVSISAREGRITIEINLVRLQKSFSELRIRVTREGKEILNTQVRLSPGRTVLIGGPKLREGVIIYAISARF